ncbi:MAG: Asp23/Gls24 family envelope stress response protein [Candidatus Atribacteria bacterium]|nr:Asp23/Gls24 family envelope stress response protein [Candidatus Atribacteria bacterium]
MKYVDIHLPEGKIEYSYRVLVKLIEDIILRVAGIDSLEKQPDESIKIEAKKESLNISLYLIFTLEKRVPEVAWDAQKNLKDIFEKKTGLKVDRIDIFVQGFSSVGLNENFENLFPELSLSELKVNHAP